MATTGRGLDFDALTGLELSLGKRIQELFEEGCFMPLEAPLRRIKAAASPETRHRIALISRAVEMSPAGPRARWGNELGAWMLSTSADDSFLLGSPMHFPGGACVHCGGTGAGKGAANDSGKGNSFAEFTQDVKRTLALPQCKQAIGQVMAATGQATKEIGGLPHFAYQIEFRTEESRRARSGQPFKASQVAVAAGAELLIPPARPPEPNLHPPFSSPSGETSPACPMCVGRGFILESVPRG